MIKLFDIVKHKTNVKGFWLDKGKMYIDNIIIRDIPLINKAWELKALFDKGELCIFYLYGKKAYIEDKEGDKTILHHCISWKEKRISKDYIKALLLQHGGLTIYRNEGYFTIEIWKE